MLINHEDHFSLLVRILGDWFGHTHIHHSLLRFSLRLRRSWFYRLWHTVNVIIVDLVWITRWEWSWSNITTRREQTVLHCYFYFFLLNVLTLFYRLVRSYLGLMVTRNYNLVHWYLCLRLTFLSILLSRDLWTFTLRSRSSLTISPLSTRVSCQLRWRTCIWLLRSVLLVR